MGRSDDRRPGECHGRYAWTPPAKLTPYGTRRISSADDLTWNTRVVIALWAMGMGADRMAPLLWERDLSNAQKLAFVESLCDFIIRLQDCGEPVVLACMDTGVPFDCSVELPYERTTWCPSCHAKINRVPCVTCASRRAFRDTELVDLDDVRLKRPRWATAAKPGSQRKIDVMATRVATGYSPFHPNDATLVPRQFVLGWKQ